MADPRQPERGEVRRAMRVLAISWVMAGAIVLGGAAGWLLDERVTGTFPLATLLGIGAGIAGGGWYAYRTIMEVMKG